MAGGQASGWDNNGLKQSKCWFKGVVVAVIHAGAFVILIILRRDTGHRADTKIFIRIWQEAAGSSRKVHH